MAASKELHGTAAFDLGSLLDAGDGAVVTLVAGETRLAAHRAVLAAGSPVLAAMFRHDTLEASTGRVAIPDVRGPVLRQLLAYLYTSQAPHLPGTAPELLAAADKYGVSGLKAHCERQVAAQLTVETAAETAVLAVRHSCSGLRQAALAFIRARPVEVMATRGWTEAMVKQPEDFTEVSQLLFDPPVESRPTASTDHQAHSSHSQTPTTAVPFVLAHHSCTPPRAEVTVCRMRTLSEERRDRRLIEVAREGIVDEVRALLAAGADVGARDEDFERTALHWAARDGRAEVASSLLAAGAAVEARDGWQNTPLHWAAYRGHAPVVSLLLDYSADADARDEDGRTPLHDAAEGGHAEVAAALLAAGADRAARNRYGETPLDLARQSNRRQLIEMLSSPYVPVHWN